MKRKGIIKIDNVFFTTDMAAIRLLFANFVPMEIDHELNSTLYMGISDQFEEIEEGSTVPKYDVEITGYCGTIRSIKFVKI